LLIIQHRDLVTNSTGTINEPLSSPGLEHGYSHYNLFVPMQARAYTVTHTRGVQLRCERHPLHIRIHLHNTVLR